MALVILFGLMSSTILNMLVVPAAWLLVHRQSRPSHPNDNLDDATVGWLRMREAGREDG